jgi:tRNA(Arg) A34 adenosine deaminase TadA
MKPGLVTYTAKPSVEVTAAIQDALAQQALGPEGVTKALQILEQARLDHPGDKRLLTLIGAMQATIEPTPIAEDVAQVSSAFANLAQGAKRLTEAADGTSKIHRSEGAIVSKLDERMIDAVNELAKIPLSQENTPAASIMTLDGKIVSLGLNRAYAPMRSWDRHGEMEALAALRQRTFAGMANVLIQFRDSGGKLPKEVGAALKKLEKQGLPLDLLPDTAESLKEGGFFAPKKIEAYGKDLLAFIDENRFIRDKDGNLDRYHPDVMRNAIASGLFSQDELADWSIYDRLHTGEKSAKMDLYTSLEPCGMCMQNCTSQGQVGRLVYAAGDEHGGGVSMLEHYGPVYDKRIPVEIVGGVHAEVAQEMYDYFFKEIYPKARGSGGSSSAG